MHYCSYSLFTIHVYFCMWYLLKHCPGNNRGTLCRSTACPSALSWPSNHYTMQSPLNFCLHSHSREEVFIQPFLTSEWWLSTSLSIGVCTSPTSSCTSHYFSGFIVLFAGDYKLQNFSPWPHAVTRKHTLPPLTHSLHEVITGCVNSIHTVGSHVLQGFHCSLSCAVSLCVEMASVVKNVLRHQDQPVVRHQKKSFF
jgi:hypothetical protein